MAAGSSVESMLALLMAPLAAAAPPPAGAVVSASIDLTASSSPSPFPHYWKRCVGSGHLLLGTRSDWQRQLKLAHDELGFTGKQHSSLPIQIARGVWSPSLHPYN
eukprot:COSAG02_NODE_1111_length_14509_cov_3.543303_4_plen_105_part_00